MKKSPERAAKVGADRYFEERANEFLAHYPSLRWKWSAVKDLLAGPRRDLVVSGELSGVEVWVTLREDQIAVGIGEEHTDFEAFGRGIEAEVLAEQALAKLIDLVRRAGLLA